MDQEHRIVVQPMLQCSAWEADWTGISDQKKRRKLQNRINQRARRLRQLQGKTDRTALVPQNSRIHFIQGSTSLAYPTPEDINDLRAIENVHILDADSEIAQATMRHLEMLAQNFYRLGSPRTDLLIHLIQFNFTKALIENIKIFGLTSNDMDDDALSPFNTEGPRKHDFHAFLPDSLRPTSIQFSTPHHPWLDLLPSAQMRDNLISAGESYDETRLCLDMKGCGRIRSERSGIIIWREPWDPSGWEITEAFAREWGWVIWNCHDLFRSTNHWRQQRSERPLFHVS